MELETDSMSPIGEPNKQTSEEAMTLAPGIVDKMCSLVDRASQMTSDLCWFRSKPKSAATLSNIFKS